MHVLVMTESWQGALACIQSLGRKGHEISVLSGENVSPNAHSIFVKKIINFRFQGDLNNAANKIIDTAKQLNIDLIIPISDIDALVVAKAKEISNNSDIFISASTDAVNLVRSRNKTISLCRSINIDTPKTLFTTHKTIIKDASTIGFPCFLKLSGTVASQGVYRIDSPVSLSDILNRIPVHAEMQLQAPIIGDLVDITGFCFEGKVIQDFAFRTDYDMSHGGHPPYARRVNNADLSGTLAKLAKALHWTGGIDLDLLERPDGSLALLEINPRFSGTIIFPLKLGIDFPSLYIEAKRGSLDPIDFSSSRLTDKDGFVSLLAELIYIKKHPKTGIRKANSFRKENNCTYDSFWDDPSYSSSLYSNSLAIALSQN